MRRLPRKEVMDGEECKVQDEEHRLPAPQVHCVELLTHSIGEGSDESHVIEGTSHADKDSKPCEGVPGGAVVQAILPGQDTLGGGRREGEARQWVSALSQTLWLLRVGHDGGRDLMA